MTALSTTHIHSCFAIKGEGGVGTAFGISDHGRWLVTAKHNLGGATIGNCVLLKSRGDWRPFEILDLRSQPEIDISIIQVAGLEMAFPPAGHEESENVEYGQQLRFLGFPHGLANTYDSPFGFNSPLCRSAHFSGAVDYSIGTMLILDGFNNPGYSGAPVWYSGADRTQLYLLGIVSGYRVEEKSKSFVYKDEEDGAESVVSGLFVKPNSGMIHAIPYTALVDLLLM